jgi:hypothetical protein
MIATMLLNSAMCQAVQPCFFGAYVAISIDFSHKRVWPLSRAIKSIDLLNLQVIHIGAAAAVVVV